MTYACEATFAIPLRHGFKSSDLLTAVNGLMDELDLGEVDPMDSVTGLVANGRGGFESRGLPLARGASYDGLWLDQMTATLHLEVSGEATETLLGALEDAAERLAPMAREGFWFEWTNRDAGDGDEDAAGRVFFYGPTPAAVENARDRFYVRDLEEKLGDFNFAPEVLTEITDLIRLRIAEKMVARDAAFEVPETEEEGASAPAP